MEETLEFPVLLRLIDEQSIAFHAIEGRSWRLSLTADGARTSRLPKPGAMPAAPADQSMNFASARGTAAELVLAFYDRIPVGTLQLEGDRRLFDLLHNWDPEE